VTSDPTPAVVRLAASYRRKEEYGRSKELLETALARDPLEPEGHASLAFTLWRMNERELALAPLRALLRLGPGHEWGWESLNEWCETLGRPEVASEAIHEWTSRRPGEVRSWLMLARVLDGPAALPERLEALERAITLNPRCFDAYDLRAELLAKAG